MIPYADGGTPPQAGGRTGLERELDIGGGVSVMIDPYGSFRFVLNGPDGPISALQVMSEDGRTGHVAGVFTRPEFRRRGYASLLLARAASMFPDLQFDEDQSPLGQVWTDAQPSYELPEPVEASTEEEHLSRYGLVPDDPVDQTRAQKRSWASVNRAKMAGAHPMEVARRVMELIERHGPMTRSQLLRMSGVPASALNAGLDHGAASGLFVAADRGSPWSVAPGFHSSQFAIDEAPNLDSVRTRRMERKQKKHLSRGTPDQLFGRLATVLGRHGALRHGDLRRLSALHDDALDAAIEHGLSSGLLAGEDQPVPNRPGQNVRVWSLTEPSEPEELSRYERVDYADPPYDPMTEPLPDWVPPGWEWYDANSPSMHAMSISQNAPMLILRHPELGLTSIVLGHPTEGWLVNVNDGTKKLFDHRSLPSAEHAGAILADKTARAMWYATNGQQGTPPDDMDWRPSESVPEDFYGASRYGRVPTAYMTTEDDFQRMLDENPHDAHTRLILADFLDDMGDPRAAGYRALGMLGHSPHAASENGAPLFIWGRSDNSAVRTYHPPMALDPEWMLATQSTHSHYPNEQWWRHHNTRREAEEQAALAFATLTPERQARILSNAQQLSRYERRHAPTAFDYDDRQYRRGQFIPGTVMFTHSHVPVEYADPPFPPPEDDPNNWATPRTDVQPNWAFWPTPDVQPAEFPRPVDPQPANFPSAPDVQPATTDAPTFDYAHHPIKRFLSTHPTIADELMGSGSGVNVSRKITYDPNHPDSGGALHAAIFKPQSGETSFISHVVNPGTYFRREAASSEIADALGMHDIFPPTAVRHHGDDVGSAQYWVNGAADAYDLPPSQRYGNPHDLARAAALDYLLGNHDRHAGNWMLLPQPTGPHKLQLIDHGLVLPNDHLTDRSEGLDTWRAQTNVLLAKAGLDNLPIPEGLGGKWPHIEQVLRSHGIEDRAIELARQRYETLTGGNYRTIGELPAWWDSQMNVPDALGAQFHRWDI